MKRIRTRKYLSLIAALAITVFSTNEGIADEEFIDSYNEWRIYKDGRVCWAKKPIGKGMLFSVFTAGENNNFNYFIEGTAIASSPDKYRSLEMAIFDSTYYHPIETYQWPGEDMNKDVQGFTINTMGGSDEDSRLLRPTYFSQNVRLVGKNTDIYIEWNDINGLLLQLGTCGSRALEQGFEQRFEYSDKCEEGDHSCLQLERNWKNRQAIKTLKKENASLKKMLAEQDN